MRYLDLVDAIGELRDDPVRHRVFLGSPWFVYRQIVFHLWGWLRALTPGRAVDRFFHETRLFYGFSFVRTRLEEHRRALRVARPRFSLDRRLPSGDLTP